MPSLDALQVLSLTPSPVGAVLWNAPEPSLTVVTKMTLALGPDGIGSARAEQPLRPPEPSLVGCPLELHHPGDLAPRKARCDVLLTGNAYAAEPSTSIGATARIGTLVKSFFALAAEPAQAIPLSLAYLRKQPSSEAAVITVGAQSALHPERARFRDVGLESLPALAGVVLPVDFDFAFWNSAPLDQQISAISPGMTISLHGLAPGGGTISGRLPTRWPRIYVPDDRRGHGLREVQLVCDTLWIDTDRSVAELTFRGSLVLREPGRLPARLVATSHNAFEKPDLAKIEARIGLVAARPVTRPEDVLGAGGGAGPPEERRTYELEAETEGAETADGSARSAGQYPSQGTLPFGQLGRMQLAGRPGPAPAPVKPDRAPGDDEVTTLHARGRAPSPATPFAALQEHTVAGASAATGTLPFASSAEYTVPRRTPPAGGLPFSRSQRQTLVLSPEDNPARLTLPFGAGLRLPAEAASPAPVTTPDTVVPPPALVTIPDTIVPPPALVTIPDTVVPPPALVTTPDTLVPPPALVARPAMPPPVASLVQPGPMEQPASLDLAGTRVPPPWATPLSGGGAPVAEGATPAAGPLVTSVGLFSLEKDAAIQLALWEGAEPLHETLARHGADELTWLEHRRLRDKELRAEAENGLHGKTRAAHEALENARRGPPGPDEPSLDLETYAALRAEMREASDKHALLAARGIDLAKWERDHRWYRDQLMKSPALAERFLALSSGDPSPNPEARPPAPPSPAGEPPANRPRTSPRRRSARMTGKPRPREALPPAASEADGAARRQGAARP